LLDCWPMLRRMEKVLPMLSKEVEFSRLQMEISAEVNRKIGEHQSQFFLKEKIKDNQKDMWLRKEDRKADIEQFEQRLEGN
ncbi:hypothetical protein, partial [Pseudomonas syringae group genomosp. 7]|uniref:hypothetical protein n=1 Tax=Pseudomonas syringae group genomosp. 7 TaxID=251699 RepID=UPI00376FC0F9